VRTAKLVMSFLLAVIIVLFAANSIFRVVNIGVSPPKRVSLGKMLVNGHNGTQYWVLYKKPNLEIKLGSELEEIIGNSRVEEVHFVQGLGWMGQPMKFEAVTWKRDSGFSRVGV
jgi:hypothetical protein